VIHEIRRDGYTTEIEFLKNPNQTGKKKWLEEALLLQ
jgi:hypothetical protein